MRRPTTISSAAFCSALLLAATACASSSRPPIQRADLVGRTYAFDAVVVEPVVGSLTFRSDGRVEIRCQGSPEREASLTAESYSELSFGVCDARLRVRRDDDGALYGIVEREIREVTGMTERCVRWITTDEGERVCVEKRRGDVTRTRTERREIELTRVAG